MSPQRRRPTLSDLTDPASRPDVDRQAPYRTGRKMRNHIYAVDPNTEDYEGDIEIAVAFDPEDGELIVDALNHYVGYLQGKASS